MQFRQYASVIYTFDKVPNDAILLDAEDSPRVGADYKLPDRSALLWNHAATLHRAIYSRMQGILDTAP